MVEVFREVRRVLRKDGTLWLNLGDSYNGSGGAGGDYNPGGLKAGQPRFPGRNVSGLKPKDLCGIPWRVALALQADGWTLRSEIIWSKKNPMPESVTDRPTRSHETIFLFSKAEWKGPEPRQFDFISDQDARWLALFLDTEGNICAKRAKSKGKSDHFGTQICFAGASLELLTTAQNIIGKGSVAKRNGKNAPVYYLQLSNRQAADLLYRLYPFMIVKKTQTALGIYLQEIIAYGDRERRTKVGRLRGRTRDDDYTEELVKIWATMKNLNHFGNSDISWIPQPQYGHWISSKYFWDQEAVREPHGFNRWGDKRDQNASVVDEVYDDQVGKTSILRKGKINSFPNSGRNLRSVWEIATAPFPEAHFATYPPELVRRCVAAGTSEKGCCSKCGAPWKRVVEKKAATSKACPKEQAAHEARGGTGFHTGTVGNDGYVNTLGWLPTCACDAGEPIPATVLDCFAGAGTTGLVAAKMGRDAVLIEIKPEYCSMAEKRIRADMGMMVEVIHG